MSESKPTLVGLKNWRATSTFTWLHMMNETENKTEIMGEFLQLVIDMRKAQTAIKFRRKPSMYDRRDAAEKAVDEYIMKLMEQAK
jgi:hypothetical protein